jgi:tRNA (guanine-N7-)-methyltransferase
MLDTLGANPQFANEFGSGFASRPECRPLTRFENRGQRLGHGVWDLCFRKR